MKVRQPLLAAVVAVLALLLLAGCGGSGGEIPLNYSFEAGDAFTYDLNMTMNGAVDGPGVPAGQGALPQDTNISTRINMKVEDVTDGVATVTYSYDSLEMTAGGQAVPAPQQQMPEITVKIAETGKDLAVEGLDEMLPPGFSMSQLPFDPSQFAGQTNLVYPEGGLAKPGDTWEATSITPIPGSEQGVESKSTGKLLSVSEEKGRQVAEVEFTVNTPLDLELDLGAMFKQLGLDKLMPSADAGDLVFKLSMKGAQDMEGVSRIDVDKGVPVDMSADLDMQLEMAVIDAPAEVVPEDQRGPFTIDMTLALTLAEVS